MALNTTEVFAIDSLLSILGSSQPWFRTATVRDAVNGEGVSNLILATSGNWYDIPHKAEALARIAHQVSTSELFLTGGRAERLTSAAAEAAGGEPLLLRQHLLGLSVPSGRVVIWNGSRVTTHNLRAMLLYCKQRREFDRQMRPVNLWIAEETFLVRRVAATFAQLIAADPEASAAITNVQFIAVGPRHFPQLVATHGGRTDVALALVHGEISRLRGYVRSGNATSATHGMRRHGSLVPANALDMLSPSVRMQLDALTDERTLGGELLQQGQHLLQTAPRSEMLRVATPIGT